MSTFNTITATTPYNNMDDVLHLYLDVASDAYVLKNVVNLIGTYTFSIWHKSDSATTITFNCLGNIENVESNSEWQKYTKTLTISNLDIKDIYISPALNVNTYFYEGFLSEGTLDNSWTPAPEDADRNFTKVYSEIEQTANAIISKVESTDGRLSQLTIGLNGVLANVETLDGNVGRLEVTANEVMAEVSDARGNSSSLAIRLGEIESRVVDENGESIIEQTSERIAMSVAQNQISKIRGSGRNLIRNSKTMLFNKYYLNTAQITAILTEEGVLVTNAKNTNDEGILLFNKPPAVDADGILIF